MSLQKWKLLTSKDVSPSKWFPIESRTYELPDGRILEDFTVTTLADIAMVIPLTHDKKVLLVKQFKPGIGEILLQFPAGRKEDSHATLEETAVSELEEETGVVVEESALHFVGKLHAFSTKATETVSLFLAVNCERKTHQKLDANEWIEVVELSFSELEEKLANGDIWDAEAIAGWTLAKKKFPTFFE